MNDHKANGVPLHPVVQQASQGRVLFQITQGPQGELAVTMGTTPEHALGVLLSVMEDLRIQVVRNAIANERRIEVVKPSGIL